MKYFITGYKGQLGYDLVRELAKRNERIVAITASMKDGTGLAKFAEEFPNRFFDIGIAEQHALGLAAGMAKDKIRTLSGGNYPIIRIMPNTPVSVNSGMILYSPDAEITDGEIAEFKDLLKFSGELDMIDETKIDAASAISGCGPAYVYIFAEALADAGVECGLPRNKAIDYAVQTILGAAELMKKSDKHSAQLKDEVCSPAGSTICGVRALEENGFRAASIKAVLAAYKRTVELGK